MSKARAYEAVSRATPLMTASAIALVAAMSATRAIAADATATAEATANVPAATVTEITVTGTSIRGVAPVGATVSVVGQQQIEQTADQTIQQILQNVPAVVGLQSAGQGGFGSFDGAGVDAPTIHGMGASASNSTLILVDGHRVPLSGLNHTLVDPNMIPPIALQRVEVLADGASSIYGSDAIAGVINFITRKAYDGAQVEGQAGFGSGYRTGSAGLLVGKSWDSGSAWVAYNYDYRSDLLAGARSFARLNHLSQGGTDLASYNCGQPTLKIGSTFYPSPYSSTNTAAATGAGMCDYTGQADLVPEETRHSVMARFSDSLNDRLSVGADVVYSNLNEYVKTLRGTATTTIFGPGSANASQINPYFTLPSGVAATSETVYWDGDSLLGPGAYTTIGDATFYASPYATLKLFGDWEATAVGTFGETTSRESIFGALNGSAVNLALNGTTNGSGSLTTPSVPGTSIIVTQALSAANALNPFLISGNPTPASVLAGITNSTQTRISRHDISDVTLKMDGTVFNLPGGPVKLAVGGEFIHYDLHLDITLPLGIGPATAGSSTTNLDYHRTVESAFAEALIPIVGADQNIPLVDSFTLSASGRYDHYSDFGDTLNPKFGADWVVIPGLRVHADYATSFTAPALTSVGMPVGQWGITGESGFGNYGLGTVTIPYSLVPTLASVPGCNAAATSCTIGTSVTGAQITGGNRYLQPETGKSWSVGADWSPSFAPGLKLSLTYWHDELVGGITSPTPSVAVNSPSLLSQVLTVYPAGATPAQIASLTSGLTQTSALSSSTYFIYNYQQRNILNLWLEGLDFSANYDFDTSVGKFALQMAGSYETKFNQQIGAGTQVYSVLNTTGANTTFPSIGLQMRSGVAWTSKFGLSANLFWNHTNGYHNWSGTTVTPIIRNAQGYPIGGGDAVAANDTIDAHLQYDFAPNSGWASGLQVYVDVQNLFDKAPPFYNTGGNPAAGGTVASGFDIFTANPIGRLTSIGLRKKF
jgi:iron complex outermembrane receptor protein